MNYSKQKGMNTLLLLFVLSMAGFVLFCFFKLGPAYLDNWYVKSSLKGLAESHPDDLNTMTKHQISTELRKFYTINNVRGDVTKNLDIDRKQDKTIVSVKYEVREPIILNIDAVMTFNNVLDSSKPDECCSVSEPK